MASPLNLTTEYTHGLILNLTTGATLTVLDRFNGMSAVEIMKADRVTWTMDSGKIQKYLIKKRLNEIPTEETSSSV